jgi:hypothetical protein
LPAERLLVTVVQFVYLEVNMTNTDQTGQPEQIHDSLKCRVAYCEKCLVQIKSIVERYENEDARTLAREIQAIYQVSATQGQQPEDTELYLRAIATKYGNHCAHHGTGYMEHAPAFEEFILSVTAWADRRTDRRSQVVGVDELQDRFTAALMREHSDDWSMEQVREAARICAHTLFLGEASTAFIRDHDIDLMLDKHSRDVAVLGMQHKGYSVTARNLTAIISKKIAAHTQAKITEAYEKGKADAATF